MIMINTKEKTVSINKAKIASYNYTLTINK